MFIPNNNNFEGLFGVFYDSLPDGWGRLLLERCLNQNKIEANILDRLALNGQSSKGALQFKPNKAKKNNLNISDFDLLYLDFNRISSDSKVNNFDELF